MSWSIVLLESAKIHANIYIYIYIYAQKLQLHIPESEAFLRYCGVQEAIWSRAIETETIPFFPTHLFLKSKIHKDFYTEI